MMFSKKLSTSIAFALVIAFAQAPFTSDAYAAEPVKKEKKRKSRAMGAFVGKKVGKAYELFEAEQVQEAIQALKDITTKDPYDTAMVNRYLGGFYATIEKMDEASKYIKMAVDADVLNTSDHASATKDLAIILQQSEKYRESIKYYYAWMDFTGKEHGDIWSGIASSHYALKEYSKVINPADKAIAAYKKPKKNPYILKIQAFYEDKKFKEAVKVLETAVQVIPEDSTFWTQLGNFYLLVEDYKKSLYTMEMAYKQGYLTTESQLKTLASLYSQLNVPYKAATLLSKHMKAGDIKTNETTLTTLAGAWQTAMHVDKAAKLYGDVAKLSNESKHYSQQGMLLKQDEQFSKAIVALNKALELKAKRPGGIYVAIAESYFYLGKYKQAYAAIKKAAKYPKTKKVAKSWTGFIRDTAKRKKVSI